MYYVVVNGELEGFFKGEKGLREGDPKIPCLFLLVMEGYYAILNKRFLHLSSKVQFFVYAYHTWLLQMTCSSWLELTVIL